jgi:hypothetical protein
VVLFVFGVILCKLRSHTIRTVQASVQWQRKCACNPVATGKQSVRPGRAIEIRMITSMPFARPPVRVVMPLVITGVIYLWPVGELAKVYKFGGNDESIY